MTKTIENWGNWLKKPTTTEFFLAGFSQFDITDEHFDLYISNYRSNSQWMKGLKKVVSPRRWFTITNCTIWPGAGSGEAILNELEYHLVYAWRGLTESDVGVGKKDHMQTLTWTARFELPKKAKGRDLKQEIMTFKNLICVDEGIELEPPPYKITRSEWLERYYGIKSNKLSDYRSKLEQEAERFFERDNKTPGTQLDKEVNDLLRECYSPEGIEGRVNAIRNKRTMTVYPARLAQVFGGPYPPRLATCKMPKGWEN